VDTDPGKEALVRDQAQAAVPKAGPSRRRTAACWQRLPQTNLLAPREMLFQLSTLRGNQIGDKLVGAEGQDLVATGAETIMLCRLTLANAGGWWRRR
jgi:hypothetical protein